MLLDGRDRVSNVSDRQGPDAAMKYRQSLLTDAIRCSDPQCAWPMRG
jgi:hypothetical protein